MLRTTKWIIALVVNAAAVWSVLLIYFWVRDYDFLPSWNTAPAPSGGGGSNRAVCNTTACRSAAKSLSSCLDTSVDPCDDFYMFSCGSWIRNNTLPGEPLKTLFKVEEDGREERKLYDKSVREGPISAEDPSPVNAIKIVYKACMDEEQLEHAGLQPLVELSNQLGGWPMAKRSWDDQHFNIQESFLDFYRRFEWFPMMQLLFEKSNGSFSQLDRHDNVNLRTILHDPNNTDKVEAYKKIIAETAFEISLEMSNETNYSQIEEEAALLVEFLKSFFKVPSVNKTSSVKSLQELQAWTDSAKTNNSYVKLDWLVLFNGIWADVNITYNKTWTTVVADEENTLDLFRLFDNTPKRVLANFLHWEIMVYRMGSTTKRMREVELKYNTLIHGNEGNSRSVDCKSLTKNYLLHAHGYKYVQTYFKDTCYNNTLQRMFTNIRTAFLKRTEGVQWLDPASKVLAWKKAQAIKMSLYPEWYENASALVDFYREVNVSNQHFANLLNLKAIRHRNNLRKLLLPSTGWDNNDVEEVQAFYHYKVNSVGILAGLVKSPNLFGFGRLEALNYGGVGYVIGHEIAHGFNTSRGTRNKTHVCDVSEIPTYLELTRCFIDQYNVYRVPEMDEELKKEARVDGNRTLNENLADNGGLTAAYRAYQEFVKQNGPEPRLAGLEEYSPDQLFFMNAAQCDCGTQSNTMLAYLLLHGVHSPKRHRTNGAVSNSADFSRAFSCPRGSNMNPEKKCDLWS